MKFDIRFKIGNRLGAKSVYTLVEFCVHVVDRYGLREGEVAKIVRLKPGETFENEVLQITMRMQSAREVSQEGDQTQGRR